MKRKNKISVGKRGEVIKKKKTVEEKSYSYSKNFCDLYQWTLYSLGMPVNPSLSSIPKSLLEQMKRDKKEKNKKRGANK